MSRAAVDGRIREVLASTYFILSENGPLCFTIGGSDASNQSYRVSIGDRHTCSCATGRAGREPCEHMLFALLKVFRVPVRAPARPFGAFDGCPRLLATHAPVSRDFPRLLRRSQQTPCSTAWASGRRSSRR